MTRACTGSPLRVIINSTSSPSKASAGPIISKTFVAFPVKQEIEIVKEIKRTAVNEKVCIFLGIFFPPGYHRTSCFSLSHLTLQLKLHMPNNI